MSEEIKELTPVKKTEEIFNRADVKARLNEMLGDRSAGFITSVLSVMNGNNLLKNADPNSVYMSAMMGASLNLPINANLGFAYIIPYNTKIKGVNGQPDTWVQKAQFQIGAKGFKQLAIRSGMFTKLHASDVRKGEIINIDRMTGDIEFDWIQNTDEREKQPVVGYVSYFQLISGLSSTLFMTVEQLKNHGLKYSQTFKKGYGVWNDDFNAMALKTVGKLNLSKNAPLSIETENLHRGLVADQGVITDFDNLDSTTYPDNLKIEEAVIVDPLVDRIYQMIEGATELHQLVAITDDTEIPSDLQEYYDEKYQKLSDTVN